MCHVCQVCHVCHVCHVSGLAELLDRADRGAGKLRGGLPQERPQVEQIVEHRWKNRSAIEVERNG